MSLPRRVLWHSDAPWATSAYAGQTRLMASSLRAAGVEVFLSAASGSAGGATSWDGMTVLPTPSNVPNALATWVDAVLDPGSGDLVITLVNTWRLSREHLAGSSVISWTPVDCAPAPPADVDHFRSTGTTAVAVSEFGRVQLRAAGIDASAIPHGIDSDVFRLLVDGDRAGSRDSARRRLGLDAHPFVVGVVAANTDAVANRKSLPEIIAAATIHARRAGPTVLYLHTDLVGPDGGFDLRPLLERATVDGGGALTIVATPAWQYRRGLTDDRLAVLYNAMDVLCAPSAGEGFCLPLLEAQACGVPVVATDFAAQPESVEFGRLVAGQPRWDPDRHVFMATVTPAAVADALDEQRAAGPSRWKDGRDFAVARDHRAVFQRDWVSLLDR